MSEEVKHSPGPWQHRLDLDPPDPGIETSGGGCVAHVQCHANINTVARTGEEFSHADAHLITAAPDLLAACKAATLLDLAKNYDQRRRILMQLLAAIAKAEGVTT